MKWKNGDFVVHTNKPEWGVGKIFDVNSQQVSIFFVDGGKRVLGQPAAQLAIAPAERVDHPLLSFIAPGVLDGKIKFRPLPQCIQHFRKLFPEGFSDPAYVGIDVKNGERYYKLVACELAQTTLNKQAWTDLNDAGQFSEICRRLGQVESKTNLLHSFEKIKWHAAIKDEGLQRPIAEALFDDLYGAGSRESRFNVLTDVLGRADGCSKWTIATYYGFLLQPEPRMFIKPEVTKFAAEACGWDLQYESGLNWNTLSRAEAMAKYLFDQLTRVGLKPRDMIDVQSFIWCIGPNSYP